jgi:hypothetical protein
VPDALTGALVLTFCASAEPAPATMVARIRNDLTAVLR